jgi:hypothetical protein
MAQLKHELALLQEERDDHEHQKMIINSILNAPTMEPRVTPKK